MHIDSEMQPYLLKTNLKEPNLYGPLHSTPNKGIERERETVAYFYQLRDDKWPPWGAVAVTMALGAELVQLGKELQVRETKMTTEMLS